MLFWETEGEHTGRKNLEAELSALNWGNGKCYSPVIFLTPIYYTISSCFPAQLMLAFMFLLNNFYDTVGQKIRSPFLSSSQVQARHSAGQNHKFSEDSVSQKLHFPSAYWLEKCHIFSHVHIFSSFSNKTRNPYAQVLFLNIKSLMNPDFLVFVWHNHFSSYIIPGYNWITFFQGSWRHSIILRTIQ